jgi:hypothetical protein
MLDTNICPYRTVLPSLHLVDVVYPNTLTTNVAVCDNVYAAANLHKSHFMMHTYKLYISILPHLHENFWVDIAHLQLLIVNSRLTAMCGALSSTRSRRECLPERASLGLGSIFFTIYWLTSTFNTLFKALMRY